jgi:uncharacterized protein
MPSLSALSRCMVDKPLPAISITVVYSPAPRKLHELRLGLPAGACVQDALTAAAQETRFAAAVRAADVGVWGKKAALGQILHDGDRVEIYRPLRVDPKVARRERFQKQGAKSAGLFAKRRPGAKPGY